MCHFIQFAICHHSSYCSAFGLLLFRARPPSAQAGLMAVIAAKPPVLVVSALIRWKTVQDGAKEAHASMNISMKTSQVPPGLALYHGQMGNAVKYNRLLIVLWSRSCWGRIWWLWASWETAQVHGASKTALQHEASAQTVSCSGCSFVHIWFLCKLHQGTRVQMPNSEESLCQIIGSG